MAKELQALGGTTGQTVYARLWSGVGTIWNGSAFETYSAGNYATYPIALTEAGVSGAYFGNFPSGITTQGTYTYEAIRQAGGSPAQTDAAVGVGSLEWGGAALAYVGTTQPVNFTGTGVSAKVQIDIRAINSNDPVGLELMNTNYSVDGYVNANLNNILNTHLTESVTGYLAAAFSHFFNVTAPTGTVNLIDANLSYAVGALIPQTGAGQIAAALSHFFDVTAPQSTVNGVVLTTSERDAVATALLDLAAGIETSRTVRQALRLILASAANKLSGAATTNIKIRDTADTKDRISATVDADGNRTAITYDVT